MKSSTRKILEHAAGLVRDAVDGDDSIPSAVKSVLIRRASGLDSGLNRREHLTTKEALALAEIGRTTLWRAVKAGKVRSVRLSESSRRVYFPADEINLLRPS